MSLSPPELLGNTERPGERRGAGEAYLQIPLRAMIPQKVDNLLVTSKVLLPVMCSSCLSSAFV